jgi:hypothetical protein
VVGPGCSIPNNGFFPRWIDRRNGAREEIWTAAVQTSRDRHDLAEIGYPELVDRMYARDAHNTQRHFAPDGA